MQIGDLISTMQRDQLAQHDKSEPIPVKPVPPIQRVNPIQEISFSDIDVIQLRKDILALSERDLSRKYPDLSAKCLEVITRRKGEL